MTNSIIAHDLETARKKSGLRQEDCAHLLDIDETRMSRIETGKREPTAREAAALSLVYGKPMESLLSGLLDELVAVLVLRVGTMPPAPKDTLVTFNRTHSLSQLAIRLEVITRQKDGGV